MRDRVLVPTLGDVYGAVLENGELKLQLDPAAGSFAIRYHEHLFPIDPREYPRIFAHTPIPATLLAADDPHRADFESLLNAFGNLPPRSETSEDAIAIRYRDKEAHKRRLVRLLERSPEIAQYLATTLRRSTARPAIRAASMLSMRCSTRRLIGCRTGAWQSMRSTIGASSTSTISQRCAWTKPACSTARIG
jgi:(1->4)-alpha-D-glucan 1-alpha-D-glucosylmutase